MTPSWLMLDLGIEYHVTSSPSKMRTALLDMMQALWVAGVHLAPGQVTAEIREFDVLISRQRATMRALRNTTDARSVVNQRPYLENAEAYVEAIHAVMPTVDAFIEPTKTLAKEALGIIADATSENLRPLLDRDDRDFLTVLPWLTPRVQTRQDIKFLPKRKLQWVFHLASMVFNLPTMPDMGEFNITHVIATSWHSELHVNQ